jgi:hypothetical protein
LCLIIKHYVMKAYGGVEVLTFLLEVAYIQYIFKKSNVNLFGLKYFQLLLVYRMYIFCFVFHSLFFDI